MSSGGIRLCGESQQSAAGVFRKLGVVEMGGVGEDSVEWVHNGYKDLPLSCCPFVLMGYWRVLWELFSTS